VPVAIELRQVAFGYGGAPVLDGLNLTVDGGQFVVLTGPNGSGKSTLIKLLVGLLEPDAGEVRILGEPAADRAVQRRIGYAPQTGPGGMVLPVSVAELVEAGTTAAGSLLSRPGERQRREISDALKAVGLDELARECVFELSGGQQQRAVIARALVGEKPVLVLDEPTASIDPAFRPRLVHELRRRADAGSCVLVVSHDPDDFHEVCDRILFMEDGRVRTVAHDDFHAEEAAR
jgi:ABC-type Mn2+/Zn2+ transport system ATPase subunit